MVPLTWELCLSLSAGKVKDGFRYFLIFLLLLLLLPSLFLAISSSLLLPSSLPFFLPLSTLFFSLLPPPMILPFLRSAPPHQRLTEGILGDDCLVSLQGFGLSLRVDSLHPELVLLAFLQTCHVKLGCLGLATWHPLASQGVQLLNLWKEDNIQNVCLHPFQCHSYNLTQWDVKKKTVQIFSTWDVED